MKKIVGIIAALAIVGIIIFRGVAIYKESGRVVYNASRIHNANGNPVEFIVAENTDGELKYPVFIKNGAAFVSNARTGLFRTGMPVDDGGHVSYVSKNIDWDTGLYRISFAGASDGQTFVIAKYTGVFMPIDAVYGDKIYIIENDMSVEKTIKIIAADNSKAVISGIDIGTKIITTPITDGMKINVQSE